MKIRTKILVLLSLICIVGFVSICGIYLINSSVNQIINEENPKIRLALGMETAIVHIAEALQGSVLNIDPDQQLHYREHSKEFESLYKSYEDLHLSPKERATLNEINSRFQEFKIVGQKILTEKLSEKELENSLKEFESAKSELLPLLREKLQIQAFTREKFAETQANRISRIVTSSVFFSLFVSLVIGVIGARKVTRSIETLIEVASDIKNRKFKKHTQIKSHDEIELLSEVLEKASSTLENARKDRKKIEGAKTQFLSITSHELRSPMTPMQAQLQMLLEGYFGKLTKKQKESIRIVSRNAKRLDAIIQDLLEVSRIEASRLRFVFKKTNLKKHIDLLIKELDFFLPEKKIKFINCAQKLPQIVTDPDRVTQVFRNLLSNAKKFSKKGEKVYLKAKVEKKWITFMVKDKGIGISEQDLPKIFQPFYQVEAKLSRSSGGTGLGLAICKGIVEMLGGQIWVKSKIGQGSEFYFTVPRTPPKNIKEVTLLLSERVF